ncbi:hypothetical protein Mgra_00003112 [Meloidogyne graminicola]|uniref:Uncharacterized protein n=1 Tax=Meloidogyne graminicola TaxID=189291 RepID=A0A8S9ZVX2_9BILA|nr:hypothetical protein Mgra_00003112 [Meloidogyne graminicola]
MCKMSIFKVLFFVLSLPDYIQTQLFDPYFGFYNSPINLYTNPYNLYPIGFGGYSHLYDWQSLIGGKGFGKGSSSTSTNTKNSFNPFYYPFYNNNNNQFNSGIFGLSAIQQQQQQQSTPLTTTNNINNPFEGILSALIGPPSPPPFPFPPTLSPQNFLFQPNGNNNFGGISSFTSPFSKKFRSRLERNNPPLLDPIFESQSLLSMSNVGNTNGCIENKNGFLFNNKNCNNDLIKNNKQ